MRARTRPSRVVLFLAMLVGGAAVFAQGVAPKETPEPTPEPLSELTSKVEGSDELDERALTAIDRGLARLAKKQGDSGEWHTTTGPYDMSVTALAGLAFLAHGEVPGRGPYGKKLNKAIDWVLRHQRTENDEDDCPGLFLDERPLQREHRAMHGHGFALLFLAEAYGQSSNPRQRDQIKAALQAGVKLTQKSQSQDGGWFYSPRDKDRDEGSITVAQIQALRAARNAGIDVPKSIIDRAVKYIHDSQYERGPQQGGVRYTVRRGDASAALTAAGIAVYYGAGEYDSPGIKAGFEYLGKNLSFDSRERFWFYTHFYAVQAMFQKGGPAWHEYFLDLKESLLDPRKQSAQGEWNDPFGGPMFGTAVAVLCLEVPLRYLPIFQK